MGVGLVAAVIDRELLEIGQDRDRQTDVPGIDFELVCQYAVVLNVLGRFFGLDEELAHPAQPESVVRGFGMRAALNVDRVLVHHLTVVDREAFVVGDVPSQRFEEGVQEFLT